MIDTDTEEVNNPLGEGSLPLICKDLTIHQLVMADLHYF